MSARLGWLAPLLLLACAHAKEEPVQVHVTADGEWTAVVSIVHVCDVREPPASLPGEDIRFGGAPGSLPYTLDGRNAVYTLTQQFGR